MRASFIQPVRLLAGVCMWIAASVGFGHVLCAQQPGPTASPSTANVTMANVTTSGFEAFTPGLDAVDTVWEWRVPRDFSRYTTPSACVAAVEATQLKTAPAAVDTAAFDPLHDTLPAAVVLVARRCGPHFSLATTPPLELRSLFELELARGNDAVALATAERYLSVQSKDEYPWALAMVVRDLLFAVPTRLVAAEAMIARLDSLGPAANVPRYVAHDQLDWLSVKSFDTLRIEREGWTLYRLRHQMTNQQLDDERGQFGFESMFETSTNVRRPFEQNVGNQPWEILWQMLELELSRSSTLAEAVSRVAQTAKTMGMDPVVLQKNLNTLTTTRFFGFSELGKPVALLPATYWFSASGDTIWPRKNHVTLLIRRNGNVVQERSDALIRRLHQRFGDALDIVVYSKTFGYFRDSPPLSPAEEAQKLRWFYFDYLKLPIAALAVLETPFGRLPDGRRENRNTAYEGHPPVEDVKLVGKDGTTLRMLANSTRGNIEATITHVLGEH